MKRDNKIKATQIAIFFQHLGTSIVNFVVVVIVGYLSLPLSLGGLDCLSLIFPELKDLPAEPFYEGYITAWGIGAILFFFAFTGYSIISKIKGVIKLVKEKYLREKSIVKIQTS